MADFSLDMADPQYVFTDKELDLLLGVIEEKAGLGEPPSEHNLQDFFHSDSNEPLALQFQPRSLNEEVGALGAALVKAEADASSSASTFTGFAAALPPNSLQSTLAPSPAISVPVPPALLVPPFLPGAVVGPAQAAVLGPPQPQPLPTQLPLPLQQQSPWATHMPIVGRFALLTAKGPAAAPPPPLEAPRGQVSHSTVEKQRRDRINSLIDELRELVPPQRPPPGGAVGGGSAEALEARRPKHVVLADTIALLKQLQHMQLGGPAEALGLACAGGALAGCGGGMGIMGVAMGMGGGGGLVAGGSPAPAEDEGPNSDAARAKGSTSSQDAVEPPGMPTMPQIPCQLTENAGVTVDLGPDCYYVQVKCRDRKGLLSDIINALRQLPLEIRTASITTCGGTVRDVFEVRLEGEALPPEELQNMVHDALFQWGGGGGGQAELAAGKRPRA